MVNKKYLDWPWITLSSRGHSICTSRTWLQKQVSPTSTLK